MFRENKKLCLFLFLMMLSTTTVFANVNLGRITGYKFNDLNGNGVDDNEPRLSDVLVTVTSIPAGFEDVDVTDTQGRFSFKNLPNGRYRVCETAPEATPPWTPTTPACVEVLLKGKTPHMRVRFGNRQVEVLLGQISGMKFNDLNGNGTLDQEEVGLANWTITITGVTDPSYENSAVTGVGGTYSFTNLPLGEYEICEVAQMGWLNTTPVCVTRELTALALNLSAVFGNKVRPVENPGCTFTQGYWKSKAGTTLMGQLIPVGGLFLGTTAYNVTQLQAFLDTPVQGNGLMNLAHQLIAAKFNLLNGASGTALGTSVTSADALIGSLVVGVDVVTTGSNPVLYAQMIAAKDTFANFNEGSIGPGHCD